MKTIATIIAIGMALICQSQMDKTLSTVSGMVLNSGKPVHITKSFNWAFDGTKDEEGNIFVVGSTAPQNNGHFYIQKYDPDGFLERNFGNKGKVTVEFIDGQSRCSEVLVFQNKIYLFGDVFGSNLQSNHIGMTRLNQDGSLDNMFGENGKILLSEKNEVLVDATIDETGVFYVLSSHSDDLLNSEFTIHSFMSDGTPNIYFGVEGTAELGEMTNAEMFSFDRELFVCSSQKEKLEIRSYKDTGAPDLTFGDYGSFSWTKSSADNFESLDLKEDAFGNLFLLGKYQVNDYPHSVLLKIRPNGKLDRSFHDGGVLHPGEFFRGAHDYHQLQLRKNGIFLMGKDEENSSVVVSQIFENDIPFNLCSSGIEVKTDLSAFDIDLQNEIFHHVDNMCLAGLCAAAPSNLYYSQLTNLKIENDFGLLEERSMHSSVLTYPRSIEQDFILQFQLESSENMEIGLTSINGDPICQFIDKASLSKGVYTEHLTLPEDIASGAYLLHLETSQQKATLKIFVK